ncbi:MAG: 30S ribosomal protein S5 [bacterium]|nr:30S ribosomal protein S5 [bacterium]
MVETQEQANTKATNTQTTSRRPRSSASARAGATAPARGQRGTRRPGGRRERTERDRRPEFDQKIINIRRVTRVMAGGRRFSFSVAMVIGDKKGRVGVGLGKAADTALAIEKAIRNAKKHMLTLTLTPGKSIAHDVAAKYGSSEVQVRPAKGRGLVAGSAVRTVLELGGVSDVTAKVQSRSKNKLNIARAAVRALKQLDN